MPPKEKPYPHLTLAQEVKRLRLWEKEGRPSRSNSLEHPPTFNPRIKTRGRPKKGFLSEGPNGTVLRIKEYKLPAYALEKPRPRGKGAKAYEFTNILKERVPLVYAFIVEELKKPDRNRAPELNKVINEYRGANPSSQRMSSLSLTAYVIERAFEGAWERYGITPPYSCGDHDAFRWRYVRTPGSNSGLS